MQSEMPEISPKKSSRYQGPRHPFDRRSRNAKRYAQLVAQFTTDAGASTEARRATINQLAGLVMLSEAMTTSIVKGDPVDAEQQVRLANICARLMRELGIGQYGRKPVPGDLEGSNDNDDGAEPRSATG